MNDSRRNINGVRLLSDSDVIDCLMRMRMGGER